MQPSVDPSFLRARKDSIVTYPIFYLLARLAEVFQELPVGKFHLTNRTQGAHQPRNTIDNLSKISFTRAQGFFSLACDHGCAGSVPPHNLSGFVAKWRGADEKPPVHPSWRRMPASISPGSPEIIISCQRSTKRGRSAAWKVTCQPHPCDSSRERPV
jgi:hypothetical protein